ncbi:phage antirepressor KilAC domain-containing protein [Asaia sp. VD9]|uniref:phage antirepressor KilAC domain-containing protein n=1 Tax=Asaia sp. VD9 TaxID=3081235 RepID=UPI0030181720
MTEIMICNQPVSVLEYAGQRVVTLAMVDAVHQRPEGTARKRFNDNKTRFVEGEDYFVRNSDEARELGFTAPKGLVLITESGYPMLAKSFKDDLAWQVQRQLVNGYFRKAEEPKSVDPMILLNDPAAMRAALLGYTEKVIALESVNAELLPKAEALNTLASLKGFHTLTQSAKSCGWPRDEFIQECNARHWIYRDKAKKIWMGYADKEKAGLLDYKPFEYTSSDGHVKAKPQVVFTARGLAKIKLLIGVYPGKSAPVPFSRPKEAAS